MYDQNLKITQSNEIQLSKLSSILNIERLDPLIYIPKIAEVYSAVFREEPWNEDWSIEKATSYLNTLIDKNAAFFGIVDEKDTVSGFIIGFPIKGVDNESELSGYLDYSKFKNIDKTFYFAEFGVDRSLRGQQAGTLLTKKLLEYAISENYEYMLVRTKDTNFSAIKVFEKCEFDFLCTKSAVTGGKESTRVVFGKELSL